MTLNQMSSVFQNATGNVTGFTFRSMANGREFTAHSQLSSGKWVIVSADRESIVNGEADRYEYTGPQPDLIVARRAAINTRLAELETTATGLVAQVEALETERASLQAELNTL
jgi:hypothetical protein